MTPPMSIKIKDVHINHGTYYEFFIDYEMIDDGLRCRNRVEVDIYALFQENDSATWLSETEILTGHSIVIDEAIATMADAIKTYDKLKGDYYLFFKHQYDFVKAVCKKSITYPMQNVCVEYNDGSLILSGGYTTIEITRDTVDFNYDDPYMDDYDPYECVMWIPIIDELRKNTDHWPMVSLLDKKMSIPTLLMSLQKEVSPGYQETELVL